MDPRVEKIMKAAEYIAAMEKLFGKGCCYEVSVRSRGGYVVK